MSSEREIFLIGDLGRVVTGKTPSTSNPSFYEGDIPFYTPSDMDGRRFLDETKRSLSELGVSTVGKSVIDAGSVMVSCIGSDMGKVAIAPKSGVTNQQINTISTHEWVDPLYIYYELSRRKAELQALATGGSAQPILNKGHFCEIEVEIPILSEQKVIANILNTLDSKIELNRKINETLEGIAKALFKSWFVDFDPVRAKVEGRPTGLTDEISELFPDSFEESELGGIPSGWRLGPLTQILQVDPKRSLSKGSVSPYLEMKAVPTSGHSTDGVYCREFTSGTKFKSGDTLLARITPCLENGKTAMVDFLEEGQIGWGSTEFIVLCGIRAEHNSFAYYLSRSSEFREYAIRNMVGSSGRQRVPSDSLADFHLPLAPTLILNAFSSLADSLLRRISHASKENSTLSELRDALLPRLISGELRVPDVEKMIGEVGI